ncbi:hypothetical protein B0H16DRAFT_1726995 [Mycena metata]|uniref:Uncharacterized protein n=1 Tax=Mycena metata TaxID=1033252 RepID=A0AAD7IKF4_9AGAR|nr:hypothetical protein B0H16DRAFT_1726995 [Mycena metata]
MSILGSTFMSSLPDFHVGAPAMLFNAEKGATEAGDAWECGRDVWSPQRKYRRNARGYKNFFCREAKVKGEDDVVKQA